MLFFGPGLGGILDQFKPSLLTTTSQIVEIDQALVPLTPAEKQAVENWRLGKRDRTWQEIWEEFIPGWPDGNAVAANQQKAQRAMKAATVNLPPCPASSMHATAAWPSGECYTNQNAYVEGPNNTWGILAPGTFASWGGVIFSAADLKDGRMTRVFKPTLWQRRGIEIQIIRRSAGLLFGEKGYYPGGYDNLKRPIIGNAAIEAYRKAAKISVSTAENLSVSQMLAIAPQMTLRLENFYRNSIQPTDTEMTAKGGWKNWIRRGGYPLVKNLVNATISLTPEPNGLSFCSSIACRCPGTGYATCISGGFPSSKNIATSTHTGFWPYVAISQDPNNAYFELTYVHEKDTWLDSIAEAGVWLVNTAWDVECGQAPTQAQALLQDVCVDANNTKCTKGTPGCTCTPPPDSQKTSVTAWGAIMNKMCGYRNEMNTPPPAWEPPVAFPPPKIPQELPKPTSTPWWLVITGGLIVGGAVFAKRAGSAKR